MFDIFLKSIVSTVSYWSRSDLDGFGQASLMHNTVQTNNVFHNILANSKNDRNGGIWQNVILKSLAEHTQRRMCFVNV